MTQRHAHFQTRTARGAWIAFCFQQGWIKHLGCLEFTVFGRYQSVVTLSLTLIFRCADEKHWLGLARACWSGRTSAGLPSAALTPPPPPSVAIGVSKQDIREQIWDYMESRNLADFPRPVHHRIPNFKVLKPSRSIQKENRRVPSERVSHAVTVLPRGGSEWGGQ